MDHEGGGVEGPSGSDGQAGRPAPALVSEGEVAAFAAARGFLVAEWFGALLLVASFALLYVLAFGAHASPAVTYTTCGILLVAGAGFFLRSRTYYARVGLDIAPRSHAIAAVVAGSAGIFWLLFAILVGLAWLGIPIQ